MLYDYCMDNLKAYNNGMEMLFMSAPAFSELALALGRPVFNPSIPTAQVEWDKDSKSIRFVMNPDFISGLSNAEVGSVIAHETYHVLHKHLEELVDTDSYPHTKVLIEAHECIINDGLERAIGLNLPEGVVRGEPRYGHDFSQWTTREAYDFLDSDDDGQDGQDSDDDNETENDESNPAGKGSGTGGNGTPVCGGVKIDPEDIQDFVKAVKNIVNDVIDASTESMPDELADMLADMVDNNGFGMANSHNEAFVDSSNNMNMNWKSLLALINPKVNSSKKRGGVESWRAPNRRLISVYPKVILPEVIHEKAKDGRGDALPTVIVALDLSPSIPTTLTKDLVSLVESIPQDLIKAYPITWSDNYTVWDDRRSISRGFGTNIHAVDNYANVIKGETGKEPYVIVITDGGFNFRYGYAGRSKEVFNKNWFWVGIQSNDYKNLMNSVVRTGYGVKEHLFNLKDFTS